MAWKLKKNYDTLWLVHKNELKYSNTIWIHFVEYKLNNKVKQKLVYMMKIAMKINWTTFVQKLKKYART